MTLDSFSRVPVGSNMYCLLCIPNKLTTLRGREGSPFLYDLENNTFTFGSAPNNAVTITLLDFVDTPHTFRQYVSSKSS